MSMCELHCWSKFKENGASVPTPTENKKKEGEVFASADSIFLQSTLKIC